MVCSGTFTGTSSLAGIVALAGIVTLAGTLGAVTSFVSVLG